VQHLGAVSWPPIGGIASIGWTADGKALTWLGSSKKPVRTFSLMELQFGPAVKIEQYHGQIRQQGPVAVTDGKVLKDKLVVARLKGYSGPLASTFFGTDQIVSGDGIGELFLYRAMTGQLMRRTKAFPAPIRSRAPSPDGRYVVVSAYDGTLCIWNPEQERPLLYLTFQ